MTYIDTTPAAGWYRSSRWYAVETVSGADDRACLALIRAGFGAYSPKRRVERFNARKGKWVTRERLLMPGYVLVEFQHAAGAEWVERNRRASWRRLLGCDGVRRALGTPDPDGEVRPFPVPAVLVEQIMAAQLDMRFDDTREARRRHEKQIVDLFPVGALVRIKDGPFASFSGEISAVNAKGVIDVLVSLMGRLVPVALEAGQVEVQRAA